MWFAWKFVPLWYQQQLSESKVRSSRRCDLLENLYLCGISNNTNQRQIYHHALWFAWKFVPLWYQQQLYLLYISLGLVVICLKICTFVVSATTDLQRTVSRHLLWFAWKFVPLWYQQQRGWPLLPPIPCCDLLENLYLCGISNNCMSSVLCKPSVVICLKICTFVVSATTNVLCLVPPRRLWFAWKFVPLWYQQQQCNLTS